MWDNSGGLLPLERGGKSRSFNIASELGHHEVGLFAFFSVWPPIRMTSCEIVSRRMDWLPNEDAIIYFPTENLPVREDGGPVPRDSLNEMASGRAECPDLLLPSLGKSISAQLR